MKTIFFKELKFNRKPLILWSAIMLLLGLFGGAEYPVVMSSVDTLETSLAALPKIARVMFGVYDRFPLATPIGYIMCMFLWYTMVAFAHAAIVGASIISKEEGNKTVEFIFTKPFPRSKVISAKIGVAVLNVAVMTLITWIISIFTMVFQVKDTSINGEISLIMIGMFLTQLMFMAFGLMFSAIFQKGTTALRCSILVVILSYVISVFIEYTGIYGLTFLSPSWYFNAPGLVSNGFNLFYFLFAVLIIFLSIGVTYKKYEKRDLYC
ncbi:ABC-2 type transport system permease protein [Seinonella peptonophila]|uniref:ABC-2 type transport system permease protein n=1 Tax=Seinonella peptonophila TaxID=112248 RepID=A0A1M4T7T8_9BACL|nr:ABC transporter permease subunit [Seinonella peptonophila]SHE40563.1 ABC-2 type transport system permease protein [Seinonella peptonophila]